MTGSLKIKNIKDASSMKLQSIKESGSAAASVVKKNVASGMVQVWLRLSDTFYAFLT